MFAPESKYVPYGNPAGTFKKASSCVMLLNYVLHQSHKNKHGENCLTALLGKAHVDVVCIMLTRQEGLPCPTLWRLGAVTVYVIHRVGRATQGHLRASCFICTYQNKMCRVWVICKKYQTKKWAKDDPQAYRKIT